MVGSNLGQYKILEKIGAGGMGEVYRAEDPKLGREVAIKVLPEEFTNDTERLARFEREAQAVAALSHPNILSIFDFGTEDGITYAVMELLEGDTLRQLVAAGPTPARKSLDYAKQIADGLAAAHDRGIIHRDLKPENVFVSRDGRVKILDFGLARQTSLTGTATDTHSPTLADATEAGAVLGTVGYMSPEQVKGEPADARSDIFSLGLVLYEMLAGSRAFERETGAEIMTAILREDPPDLASKVTDLSPAVDRLVRHCLEKRPEERFQSARDLAFDLEAMTGFSTTGAVPSLDLQPVARGRWKWLAALTGVLLLVGTHYAVYKMTTSAAPSPPPRFQRLTFQRGTLAAAQFAPDGQTVIYSASWYGQELELYSTRLDSPESKPLGLPSATLYSVSSTGDLAIGLDPDMTLWARGRLATVPLLGGAPREVAGRVDGVDWSPDGQSLLIADRSGGQATLEYPPGKVIHSSPGRITYPRVSSDGMLVAYCHNPIPNDTQGEVMVVDLEGSARSLTEIFSDLRGLAWSPDGEEIWFTAQQGNESTSLHAVSLSGQRRTLYRGVGDVYLKDVSPEGRILLERYSGGWEMGGRGPDGDSDLDLSLFDWTLIRDVSRDGKTILFGESGDAAGSEYAVYLRGTDGSPAVRLGEGAPESLSPSGQWVIARSSDSKKLILYPTGAGQSKILEPEEFESFGPAVLIDDPTAFLMATKKGQSFRAFLLDLTTEEFEAVTEEGVAVGPVSPDGSYYIAFGDEGPTLEAFDGSESRPVLGIEPFDQVVNWTEDGQSLYVSPYVRSLPRSIFILDPTTGERRLFKEVGPVDRAGAGPITSLRINPAGTAYAYSHSRVFSELHLVEGLE